MHRLGDRERGTLLADCISVHAKLSDGDLVASLALGRTLPTLDDEEMPYPMMSKRIKVGLHNNKCLTV